MEDYQILRTENKCKSWCDFGMTQAWDIKCLLLILLSRWMPESCSTYKGKCALEKVLCPSLVCDTEYEPQEGLESSCASRSRHGRFSTRHA